MPTLASSLVATVLILDSLAAAEQPATLPPPTDAATVIVSPGITDDFAAVREAVARVKAAGGRDYRVVVVDSSDDDEGAAGLLPRLVDRWWEARTQGGSYGPAGDVTILLDIGDRSLAMDVPPSLLAEAGLDLDDLERDVIKRVFVPRAKDMRYADGLAELVAATEGTIRDRIAARVRRARTLPLCLAGLAAAAVVGWLAFLRLRHVRRRVAARDRLATFKQEVVALSDLLDAQCERHRMLPHADADFKTPMTGMTRKAYDDVQDAIGRYRDRWLSLMNVWEWADKRFGEESFLGTKASDDVIAMLDAADARQPLRRGGRLLPDPARRARVVVRAYAGTRDRRRPGPGDRQRPARRPGHAVTVGRPVRGHAGRGRPRAAPRRRRPGGRPGGRPRPAPGIACVAGRPPRRDRRDRVGG